MEKVRDVITRWQFKEQWDFIQVPGDMEFQAYADAVLAAAAHSGVLEPAERNWVVGYFASIGMPDEGVASLQQAHAPTIGPKMREHLHAFLATPAGPFNRGLVYDCIRATSADGEYRPHEAERVHRIAHDLNIPDQVTQQIENVYHTQQRMKADKLKLLFPNGAPYMQPPAPTTPAPQTTRAIIAAWHFEEEWGFLQIPGDMEFQAYADAVLAAAAGDGVLAPEEREWIVGYFASIGMPDEGLEQIQRADAATVAPNLSTELREFLATPAGPFNRGLVYDCVRAASADGEYHPREAERILQIGRELNIPDEITHQIEDVYKAEQALKATRLKLFFPAGAPYMQPAQTRQA